MSQSQSSTFHVLNTGTLPAKVHLALDPDGSAAFSTTAGSPTVVSSGVDLTVDATFSPSTTGEQTGSFALEPSAGAVLCAPVPTPLTVTGSGENGGLTVGSNALSFGPTGCGPVAPPQTVTLTNSGNATLQWSLALSNTSPSRYVVTPTTVGSLAQGASVTLTVTPGAIPATSSVQTNLYADAITINTDAVGDLPHTIALSRTAKGAILAFNPASLAFGERPVATTGTAPLQVVNSGNAGATVTLTSSAAAFVVTPASPELISAGSPGAFTGAFSPGASATAQTGSVTMSTLASDTLCAPLPLPLVLTGTGTNEVVALTPGALTFGEQAAAGLTACGTKPRPSRSRSRTPATRTTHSRPRSRVGRPRRTPSRCRR